MGSYRTFIEIFWNQVAHHRQFLCHSIEPATGVHGVAGAGIDGVAVIGVANTRTICRIVANIATTRIGVGVVRIGHSVIVVVVEIVEVSIVTIVSEKVMKFYIQNSK